MFGEFDYHKILISVVFALEQFINYWNNQSWILTCFQVIYTFFLGYYLAELDSIWEQIGTHALMNFLAISIELVMIRYLCPSLFDTEYFSRPRGLNGFYPGHPRVGKFVKSSSCNNLQDITKLNTEYEKQQYCRHISQFPL